MQRKIGEIFEFKKDWYQCVEGRCKDCHFSEKRFLCKQFITKDFCTHGIIFKKLEKVGEPFIGKVHIQLQRYKIYTEPIIDPAENVGYINEKNTIAIEIKQTNEDMEENKMYDAKEDIPEFDKVVNECLFGNDKLNLKPFDIQKAREGKPVCTRDGRKVRIICFDRKGGSPVIALVETFVKEYDCIREDSFYYTVEGRAVGQNTESKDDLMMLPERKEGWVNIVRGSDGSPHMGRGIFQSKEEAENTIKAFSDNLIDTVKICWEE